MPCGFHDPMAEEQPCENNGAGAVNRTLERRCDNTGTPARRKRMGSLATDNTCEMGTVLNADT